MANRSNRCKTKLLIHCLWLAVVCTCPLMASAQPDVTATDGDALENDADSDGNVDRGDTIRHEITITNDAGAASDAQGVQYDNTPDADTTLVTGSVRISPIAYDDSYDSVGNATLSVDAGSGLLNNDVDPVEGGAAPQDATAAGVTVTAETVATSEGGSATLNADGSFSYTPEGGDTGITDTFTYTITDNDGMTDTATASVVLTNMVWFVDDDAPGGGDGTQANPFHLTDDYAQLVGAGDVDSAGDYIFLRSGSHDGNIVLEDNQTLAGEGQDLVVGGNTLVSAGVAPTLANSSGDVVTLGAGNTVQGLNINATAGAALAGNTSSDTTASTGITTSAGGSAVSLVNTTGTFTLNGSITGSGTGDGYAVDGGTATINHTGAISVADGQAIAIVNTTGGGATFSGGISASSPTSSTILVQNNSGGSSYQFGGLTVTASTADAVTLTGNAGTTTYTFGGDFNVTTSGGAGLVADSGTIALADAGTFNNSIDATGGAAVDLSSVGVGTMAWDSLASTGSAGAGINLATITGSSFTVNATTTTIDNAAGAGINISGGSADVTLSSAGTVNIDNRNAEGIMVGSTGGNVTFGDVNINALNSGTGTGLSVDSTTGTVTFGDITITDSGGDGLAINATAGVDFTGTTIGSTGNVAGIGVNITGANSNTIDLGGGSIANTGGTAFRADSGTADINYTSASISTGAGVPGIDLDNGSGTVTISGTLNQSSGGSAVTVNGGSRNVDLSGLTVTNSSTTSGANVIAISSTTGGAVDFGTVDITGAANADAVTISNHGGSLSFADLDVAVSSGEGINVDTVGTLTVTTGTIDATDALGVDINAAGTGSNVTFGNVTVSNSSGGGVDLTGNSGSYTFSALNVTTTGGTGFNAVNAGTINVSNSGTGVDATNAVAVNITDSALNASFSNAASSGSSTGVNLSNNTGNITFNDLSITHSGGTGFTANNSGTLTITDGDSDNRIDATSGTALNVTDTDIGGTGLNFTSIDVSGGANGIVLNNTGSGGLTVTGDGATAGSGGTIQNTTADSVSLTATQDVALNFMNITGSAANGVLGSNVTGFTLNGSTVENNGDQVNEGALRFDQNLLGTATISNSTLRASAEHNVEIINTSSTALTLTITGSTISDTDLSGLGADGLLLETRSSANASLTVTDSTFSNNVSDGIQVSAIDSSTASLTVDESAGTSSFANGARGLNLSAASNANLSFSVTDTDFDNFSPSLGEEAINLALVSTSTASSGLTGTIDNNVFSNAGGGVGVDLRGDGIATLEISNNTMTSAINRQVIDIITGDATGDAGVLNLTALNNSLTSQNREAFFTEALRATSLCMNIRGNSATPASGDDAYVIYGDTTTGDTQLESGSTDCGGAACADAADHITSNNTGTPVTIFDINLVAPGTCPTPP